MQPSLSAVWSFGATLLLDTLCLIVLFIGHTMALAAFGALLAMLSAPATKLNQRCVFHGGHFRLKFCCLGVSIGAAFHWLTRARTFGMILVLAPKRSADTHATLMNLEMLDAAKGAHVIGLPVHAVSTRFNTFNGS